MPVVLKGKKNNIELKPSSSSIELQVPVSSGAVSSVNGQTGDVVIDVPSKVSELQNDLGYLTEHQSLDTLATKEALNNGLAAKQDKLTAGENITIQNNIISGSYTLPQASYSRLGGVKVVSNTSPYNNSDTGRIKISDDGVLYINDEFDEKPKDYSDGKQYALLFIGKNISGGANPQCRVPYIRQQGFLYPLPFRAGTAINISDKGIISVDTTQVSANNGVPSGGGYPQILIKNTVKDYDTSWSSLPDLLNYYGIGSSNWNTTTSLDEGNLYNAKELVIFWKDKKANHHQTYLNVGSDYWGNNGQTWGSSSWLNTSIYLDNYDLYNGAYIMYNGSSVDYSNCSINAICYKS